MAFAMADDAIPWGAWASSWSGGGSKLQEERESNGLGNTQRRRKQSLDYGFASSWHLQEAKGGLVRRKMFSSSIWCLNSVRECSGDPFRVL